jgi:hypothetical protein
MVLEVAKTIIIKKIYLKSINKISEHNWLLNFISMLFIYFLLNQGSFSRYTL